MNNLMNQFTTHELDGILSVLKAARDRDAQQCPDDPPEYYSTELGNGKRFADMFSGQMIFVPEQKQWFYWNDRLWTPDNDGLSVRKFEAVIAQLETEKEVARLALAGARQGSEMAGAFKARLGELTSWHKTSQRMSVIKNSLQLAAAQTEMSIPITEFDTKGHFFGCANGIVDLRDGTLVTGDSRYLMTKASAVRFTPDALCPEWERFLLTVMNGNLDNVRFLQRLVGQAMLGDQGKDKLTILWGAGANGKSTFVDTLNDVFGPYATVTDPNVLMGTGQGHREYFLAPLKGVRLLLMSETKRGDMIAESMVKMLVDGGDIAARYPAGRVFTYQPVFTPILSTNHRPKVGADAAVWRRVLLVPFTYTIPVEQRNPHFRSKVLAPEHEGIFRWCVEGALMYQRDGLAPTGDVVSATEQYRQSQDRLGLFFSEECELNPTARVTVAELHRAYSVWCTAQGLHPGGRPSFKEDLLAKNLEVRQSTGHRDWAYGVKIRGIELEPSRRESPFFKLDVVK